MVEDYIERVSILELQKQRRLACNKFYVDTLLRRAELSQTIENYDESNEDLQKVAETIQMDESLS